MKIGEQIRKYRIDGELSLRSLAKRLKISHVFMGEVERGTKDMPRKYWPKLAREIGITVEDLEKWDEDNWCESCEQRIPISRRF